MDNLTHIFSCPNVRPPRFTRLREGRGAHCIRSSRYVVGERRHFKFRFSGSEETRLLSAQMCSSSLRVTCAGGAKALSVTCAGGAKALFSRRSTTECRESDSSHNKSKLGPDGFSIRSSSATVVVSTRSCSPLNKNDMSALHRVVHQKRSSSHSIASKQTKKISGRKNGYLECR